MVVHVDLHRLLARHLPRVLYVYRYGQAIHVLEAARRHFGRAVLEARVAQPTSEGEEHRRLSGVVVTIADKEALAVAHFAAAAGVVDISRSIDQLQGEGFGEPARGVSLAEEHLRDSRAARLAHHPRFEHG